MPAPTRNTVNFVGRKETVDPRRKGGSTRFLGRGFFVEFRQSLLQLFGERHPPFENAAAAAGDALGMEHQAFVGVVVVVFTGKCHCRVSLSLVLNDGQNLRPPLHPPPFTLFGAQLASFRVIPSIIPGSLCLLPLREFSVVPFWCQRWMMGHRYALAGRGCQPFVCRWRCSPDDWSVDCLMGKNHRQAVVQAPCPFP